MARRGSWKETDVTYAIRQLLDRCGLDYEVVNDERLPRPLRAHAVGVSGDV
jgi:hypothetical protein